jgi:hypothetical protein
VIVGVVVLVTYYFVSYYYDGVMMDGLDARRNGYLEVRKG